MPHVAFQLLIQAFLELLKEGPAPGGKDGKDPGGVNCRFGDDVVDQVGGSKNVALDVQLLGRN